MPGKDQPPAELVDAVARELGQLAKNAATKVERIEIATERLAVVAEAVEKLAEAIEQLATKDEVEATATALERRRRLTAAWLAIPSVLSVALLVVNVFLLAQIRVGTAASDEQRRLILECTTPSLPDEVHECYEAGERRTQDAIRSIVEALRDKN